MRILNKSKGIRCDAVIVFREGGFASAFSCLNFRRENNKVLSNGVVIDFCTVRLIRVDR